jgi:MFS family permease
MLLSTGRLTTWTRISNSLASSTTLVFPSSSLGRSIFDGVRHQLTSLSYLLGQVPSNMLLNRIKPSWYMSGWMMAWAVVSTLMAVVKDYKGMLACRFVLGITEAPFYPGGVYLISMFYTRKESATRMSVFYTGNLLASSFSGLIAAPIFSGLEGRHGLEGWRWLFIIQGLITGMFSEVLLQVCITNTDAVGVAILAFFMLPNAPLETRWLTQEERELAHSRIAFDTTEKEGRVSVWKGLREACTDYRMWVFALMQNLHLSANGQWSQPFPEFITNE